MSPHAEGGYDYIHARDGPSLYINRQTHNFFLSLSGISFTAKSNCNCTDDIHTLHSSVKKTQKTRGKQKKTNPESIPPCQHKARGPPCCSESGSCNLRQPAPIYM